MDVARDGLELEGALRVEVGYETDSVCAGG